MLNLRKICVFDFETDSPDPHTCQPVELAAIMIDPRKLKIIEKSDFSSMMRPADIDDETYYEEHKDTIDWHARQLDKKPLEILESWKAAPLQKNAWSEFKTYLKMYHVSDTRKSSFTAPICAGYNHLGFDNYIIQRLSEKYNDIDKRGKTKLFFGRDQLDVMHMVFMFFENLEALDSYSLDSVRKLTGMPSEGAHRALKDVEDTGEMLIRFMRQIRQLAGRLNFKDAHKRSPLL